MQPSETMMRITANGMAMMPEQFPQEPVLAGQAKKDMIIMIRGRACQIRDVTWDNTRETMLICIQAQTLCGARWEDMKISRDVPLEFPGHKKAIAAVHKALLERERRTDIGSTRSQWPTKSESAETPLEEEKVKVKVANKEVVVEEQALATGEYSPLKGQDRAGLRWDPKEMKCLVPKAVHAAIPLENEIPIGKFSAMIRQRENSQQCL